ncbi:MAG: hypothetical protein DCC74_01815 [Proteobacteria bacterium]|nr:MAG: hypothetical protein DCC74_01815 [Pseudomonadota bacterium]
MHIEMTDGDFCIDAALLGTLFGLAPERIPPLMRANQLTGVCERGVGEDDGTYRLNFFYGSRRARLNVDARGVILKRSIVDFGDQPLPRSMRRS